MKGKKVVDFILLRPAFSSRNLTSLLLVAIFFGVYVLAGGKVEIPDVKQGANFGSVVRTPTARDSAGGELLPPAPVLERTERTEKQSEADKLSDLEERLKNLKRKNGSD